MRSLVPRSSRSKLASNLSVNYKLHRSGFSVEESLPSELPVRFVITVDGTAASGKSCVARRIAKHYGALHVNSGLLYRFLAWRSISSNVTDEGEIVELLVRILSFEKPSFIISENNQTVFFVSGEPFKESIIENEEVASKASRIATFSSVRRLILNLQQSFLQNNDRVVLEGRDCGTRVAPKAEVKIYIDCDLEVRVNRRLPKVSFIGETANRDLVKAWISERDYRDKNRSLDPLVLTDDMFFIDNSSLTVNQSFRLALKFCENKLNIQKPSIRLNDNKFTIRA